MAVTGNIAKLKYFDNQNLCFKEEDMLDASKLQEFTETKLPT